MSELRNLIALPSSSTTLHTDDNKGKSASASVATPKFVTNFANKELEKIFPKEKGPVSQLPSAVLEDTSLKTDLSTVLGFEKLVEEICLKIWVLLRDHLKLTDQYEEEMERWYRDSIKQQVRSYLSWVGTGLQIASVAVSVCSLGNAVLPSASSALGEKLKYFRLFAGVATDKIPESVAKVFKSLHEIISSFTTIHGNYAGADRTSAQGESELAKTRMEKISRKTEESRNERNSVIQTLKEMYQQEADARKAISR